MEESPSRMLAVLRECGALARVLPELDATFSLPQVPERLAARIDHAAGAGFTLPVRYAALMLDLAADDAAALAERVNAPSDCRDPRPARDPGARGARGWGAARRAIDPPSCSSAPTRCAGPIASIACWRWRSATCRRTGSESASVRTALRSALDAARRVDAGWRFAREHADDIPRRHPARAPHGDRRAAAALGKLGKKKCPRPCGGGGETLPGMEGISASWRAWRSELDGGDISARPTSRRCHRSAC